ncbi:MAG TPA: XdhC/CoxI family protein [Longimicrobiales bacterium]|nr:XdhC/CoxI family protein [Longimicrobiales bacterium]
MSESGTDAVLRQARAWRSEGRQVALATVLDTWGSAPRRPGAHMAVTREGDFVGSVSGGCVEVAVADEARGVLDGGGRRIVEYGVADEEAWAVGLACGGRIRVLVEPVGPGGLGDELLATLVSAREQGRAVVLATDLSTGEHLLTDSGSDRVGGDGRAGGWEGEVGHVLRLDRARVVGEGEGEGVFLRPHNPPVRIVIVGAVHLAQALAPLVAAVGYRPTVVDPRDAFATEARFPGIPLLRRWPGEALDALGPDARTGIVVVTHDPKFDDPALIRALESPAFYVGALGSRRTHARRLERLREAGVPEEDLGRIRAPVGLDIGARSPEEIAVAILGEMVQALRRPDEA